VIIVEISRGQETDIAGRGLGQETESRSDQGALLAATHVRAGLRGPQLAAKRCHQWSAGQDLAFDSLLPFRDTGEPLKEFALELMGLVNGAAHAMRHPLSCTTVRHPEDIRFCSTPE